MRLGAEHLRWGWEGKRGQVFLGSSGPTSVSLTAETERTQASPQVALQKEASWLQPGTALAQAFKGFLTGRPLHQHSANFLQGLQLHQDYCNHQDFSTWAGKGLWPSVTM